MAEQTQVQQVTTKDPKKAEVGKRLAESNRSKREERARLAKAQCESKLTYYGTGAIVAIGALDILGHYMYQLKKAPRRTPVHQINETSVHQPKETPAHKFEMKQAIKWIRKVSLMTYTKQRL